MAINLPIVSKFYDQGVKNAESSLKKFGAFAAKSAAAATAAIGAIAVLSVKAFGDFDAALNKSISIMGNVSDTLRNDMSDAAREVAKNTTFSAEEAADAYFFLASAGLDAEASIAAMPQVAKFAQAGMFDMATATDLATDAQSALGLTSDDAAENLKNLTRVTDVFVKANTLANTSVEQLAAAFTSKAGNALKTVGKSVEEGAAALAVFADQGIKGERAGTLLTNTIFGLTDSLEKNGAQYKELGIELFDNEGKMLSFAGIAEQFTGVLGTMSTEQKLTTLSQLGFNKQAREGILALVGNEAALAEYETKLKEAGGTVDEVSGKQLETFNAQMELMKSRLMDVAIQIGSELAPKLLTLFDRIAPIIDKAAPVMLALFEKIESILADMSAELAPLIQAALPDLRKLFDDLKEPIGQVLEFLTVLAKEILGAVIGLVTTPAFLEALATIGKSFGVIAENVAAFLKSPVVDFLMGLISNTIIVGLNVLATAIQIVANTFAAAVSAIEAFNRTTPRAQSIPSTPTSGGTSGYITDNRSQTVPKFAEGGIVMPTPGGTLGIIGEAGQAEAVIPLDKLDRYTNGGGGNSFNITVNAGMGSDGGRIGQLIVDEIKKFERSNGPVFAGA
jgi:TP901 family phage tail tape measure protein